MQLICPHLSCCQAQQTAQGDGAERVHIGLKLTNCDPTDLTAPLQPYPPAIRLQLPLPEHCQGANPRLHAQLSRLGLVVGLPHTAHTQARVAQGAIL